MITDIEKIEQIIKLGSVMLSNKQTEARGANLLIDLANQLLPELVQVNAAGPKSPAAPTTAPVAALAAKAPAPIVAAPAAMTPEELNSKLVVEFKRLGSREGIDNAMAELGVTSVNDLTPAQYQPLLTKVQSIQ